MSALRKLRQLEDENARLWRIVADLALDKQILQKALKRAPGGRFSRDLARPVPAASAKKLLHQGQSLGMVGPGAEHLNACAFNAV